MIFYDNSREYDTTVIDGFNVPESEETSYKRDVLKDWGRYASYLYQQVMKSVRNYQTEPLTVENVRSRLLDATTAEVVRVKLRLSDAHINYIVDYYETYLRGN